jgi:hypothetical protein
MPAADAALKKKKVDYSKSCAPVPRVAGLNVQRRSESLDEVTAFRMRLEFEQLDKLTGSRMHDTLRLTVA